MSSNQRSRGDWIVPAMMSLRDRPVLSGAVWHAVVVATILWLLPTLLFADPFWALPGVNTQLILGFAAAYLAALATLGVLTRFFDHPRVLTAFLVTAGALALVYLETLLLPVATYSRALVLAGSAIVAGGLLAPHLVALARQRLLLVVATFVALGGGLLVARRSFGGATVHGPSRRTQLLPSSHETLSATFYVAQLPATNERRVTGGAIAADPDGKGYLLVRGRGQLYRLLWDQAGELHVETLGIRVPINNAEFEADVPKHGIETEAFRVADLLATGGPDGMTIFVSHHYWKRKDRCFVVRVSSHVLPRDGQARDDNLRGWQTVYESAPCLPLKRGRGAAFAGVQIGGNLAEFGVGKLLLTVGDHQFDGWYGTPNYVRDRRAHYGKTMLIDLSTGSASFFTYGNRNAQGLEIDASGRIWETEHGPEGGDELNLLKQGADYGWPYHSFGTEYGSVSWPLNDESGAARRYVHPVFAWVPSIGISDLVAVSDTAFDRWRDDLLIASLAGRALWRVRLEDGRVVYSEPIQIGERVRDIAAGRGEFVLWTDSETIVRLTPARTLDRGAELFAVSCGGCHDDDEHRIGPNLNGMFDRSIATADGYEYSSALRHLGGRWTEARLHAFISKPDSLVPGTTMRFGGVSDRALRSAIIAYLKSTQ